MEENPYKAPAGEAESAQQAGGKRRWLALLFAIPCLLVAVFCLIAACIGAIELISGTDNISAHWGEVVVFFAFYSINAVMWAATTWAVWKGYSRALIAALLVDLVIVAMMTVLG